MMTLDLVFVLACLMPISCPRCAFPFGWTLDSPPLSLAPSVSGTLGSALSYCTSAFLPSICHQFWHGSAAPCSQSCLSLRLERVSPHKPFLVFRLAIAFIIGRISSFKTRFSGLTQDSTVAAPCKIPVAPAPKKGWKYWRVAPILFAVIHAFKKRLNLRDI